MGAQDPYNPRDTHAALAYCGLCLCRGLRSVSALNNLRHLNLSDTAITDHSICSLSRLRRLKYLNLSHSGALQALTYTFFHCPCSETPRSQAGACATFDAPLGCVFLNLSHPVAPESSSISQDRLTCSLTWRVCGSEMIKPAFRRHHSAEQYRWCFSV